LALINCFSICSASAFGIISFVVEKAICASAKAAIVEPAACSGLLKSSSSAMKTSCDLLNAAYPALSGPGSISRQPLGATGACDLSVAGVSSLCDFCNKFDLLNLGHNAELIFP